MSEKSHDTEAGEHSSLWLDLSSGCLRRGDKIITLRPKTLAVLRYLADRYNKVVPHTEIQTAVWPDAVVTPGVLRNCILELRAALADPVHASRYIATVPRLGYRLLSPIPVRTPPASQPDAQRFTVLGGQNHQSQEQHSNLPPFPGSPPPSLAAPGLVGRAAELEQLDGWLAKALRGERQMIFVMGEPGIGKTALINTFVEKAAQRGLWVAQGQCIEHYGVGEAYLPFLEALSHLGRRPDHQHLLAVLRQHAPTWLAELPGLLTLADREQLQRELLGSTRERMPRELGEALDVLAAEIPLVLVLEDLHWSDHATLVLLSSIARRRSPTRLLLLGTFRPAEVLARQHPLNGIVQELQTHGCCEELPLGPFSEAAAEEYLSARFPGSAIPAALVRAIHQRTEGTPFFLGKLADEMVSRGIILRTGEGWQLPAAGEQVTEIVPDSVRHLIEKQLDLLSLDERRMLEAASVAGIGFSAAAIAAALEQGVPQVEELCERLARRYQFLRAETPETPLERRKSARYRFVHSFYREVVYTHMTAGQRASLHQRIGVWKEAMFGARAEERAVELAAHFEQGHDYPQAVRYRWLAAQTAIRRSALREALSHLTRALTLLRNLPDTPERAVQELLLHIATGTQLMATRGFAAPEVEGVYARAGELCRQTGATAHLPAALSGLFVSYLGQAKYGKALKVAKQLNQLARRQHLPFLALAGHNALGATFLCSGKLDLAWGHLEQSRVLCGPQQEFPATFHFGLDPRVACQAYGGVLLWLRGYAEQAVKTAQEAVTLAQKLQLPFGVALGLQVVTLIHQLRREFVAAQAAAAAEFELSQEHGFSVWQTLATILRGAARVTQEQTDEGLGEIRSGIAAYRATGARIGLPYCFALLAEAYGRVGRAEQGLDVLAEGFSLVHQSGERWWEAELRRLRGELILQAPLSHEQHCQREVQEQAEACFRQAITTARQQGAKSLELRAATSLGRLWRQRGKHKQAHRMLAELYSQFTEGFDTADLVDARVLLSELIAEESSA